jgi:hypothetical protein
MMRRLFLAAAMMVFGSASQSQTIDQILTTQKNGGYCSSDSSLPDDLGPYLDLILNKATESPLPDGWNERYTRPVGDAQLRYSIYEKGDQAIAVFQGIKTPDPGALPLDYYNTGQEFATEGLATVIKKTSKAYNLALLQMNALRAQYSNLALVGHSKGGGLVRYLSSKTGLPGIAIDPQPVTAVFDDAKANVLNISHDGDVLQKVEKVTGSRGIQKGMSLQVHGKCKDPIACHDVELIRDRMKELAANKQPNVKGRKCDQTAAEKFKVNSCNPLGISLRSLQSALARGEKPAYMNECIISNEHKLWEDGENPAITYMCNGTVMTGVVKRTRDWQAAQGYAGEDRRNGGSVLLYRGDSFSSPCLLACFGVKDVPDDNNDISGLCAKEMKGVKIPRLQRNTPDVLPELPKVQIPKICLFGQCLQ